METFGIKSLLAGIRNPINGAPIVLKEKVRAHQKAIKDEAESEGLITTTCIAMLMSSLKQTKGISGAFH